MDWFYDKTCTIRSVWYVDNGVSEVFSKTSLYTNIPCDFWDWMQNNYNESDTVRENDKLKKRVNLQPLYTQVQKWDNIEIYNSLWISQGIYVVDDVNIYLSINWLIDNIELSISSR